jgi:hypothetical protein
MDSLVGTIVAAKRLPNSTNGNPRFDITVKVDGPVLGGEDYLVLRTSSDAACNYDVENLVKSREQVWIGRTRAGRVDRIAQVGDSRLN